MIPAFYFGLWESVCGQNFYEFPVLRQPNSSRTVEREVTILEDLVAKRMDATWHVSITRPGSFFFLLPSPRVLCLHEVPSMKYINKRRSIQISAGTSWSD